MDPGDPLILEEEKEKFQGLLDAKIPMLGICLGTSDALYGSRDTGTYN